MPLIRHCQSNGQWLGSGVKLWKIASYVWGRTYQWSPILPKMKCFDELNHYVNPTTRIKFF